MTTFVDATGRAWSVPPLSLRAACEAARATGCDPLRPGTLPEHAARGVLWHLLREQAAASGVSAGDFLAAFDAAAVQAGCEAVRESVRAARESGEFPRRAVKVVVGGRSVVVGGRASWR